MGIWTNGISQVFMCGMVNPYRFFYMPIYQVQGCIKGNGYLPVIYIGELSVNLNKKVDIFLALRYVVVKSGQLLFNGQILRGDV